jgi:hypothetical protein
MHICQAINAWDHPMTHPLQPTHDHLGIPMTRPRGSPAQSILDMMTLRPGWRCWHDPSRCHRPSIPEIKHANFITKFRYEEQWYTIEKWKSLYALYHPLELANWGGTNPGFTLEPITKIIYSKLRIRKWIMRSCNTYRHAKLKLIKRHQRQIMPTKLCMTSKRHHRAINIIIKHLRTMRGLWWSRWYWSLRFFLTAIHDDQRHIQITLPSCDLLWCLIIVSLDVDIALMLTLVNSTYIVPQS